MAATDNPAGHQRGTQRLLEAIARCVLIVHAALLVAQPFIAGTMLDGRSADAQAWHLNIGMALPTIGFVQIIVTLLAWRLARWPQGAFTGSIAVWVLELAQFFIGYLGMPLAMHIPLGLLLVVTGVGITYAYGYRTARNATAVAPEPTLTQTDLQKSREERNHGH